MKLIIISIIIFGSGLFLGSVFTKLPSTGVARILLIDSDGCEFSYAEAILDSQVITVKFDSASYKVEYRFRY